MFICSHRCRLRRNPCQCCGRRFLPDPRIGKRQRYCEKPLCRRASRAASRARWLAKPENAQYFKGTGNALRVRLWRAANPRPKKPSSQKAMQSLIEPTLAAALKACGVQDMSERQLALVLGLVSALAQSDVQDVIARKIRRLMFAGYAVLRSDDAAVPRAPRKRGYRD